MKFGILKRAIEAIDGEGIGLVNRDGREVFAEAIGMAEYLLGRLEEAGAVTVAMGEDENLEEYTSGCTDSWAAVGRMLDGAGVQVGGSSSDRLSEYIRKSKSGYSGGYAEAWADVGMYLDDAGTPASDGNQPQRLREYIKAMKEQAKGLMQVAYQSGGRDGLGLVEIARHVAVGRAAERNRIVGLILGHFYGFSGISAMKRVGLIERIGGGVDEACPSRLSREAFGAGEREERRRVLSICDEAINGHSDMGRESSPCGARVLAIRLRREIEAGNE